MSPFDNWTALNKAVMATTDEAALKEMMAMEMIRRPPRKTFIRRINDRLGRIAKEKA